MLSVTTDYHGSLDDLISEFPDYRFVLTRSELEQVAEKEILIPFQQLVQEFVQEWTTNERISSIVKPLKIYGNINQSVKQDENGRKSKNDQQNKEDEDCFEIQII
ncbi:MAG: hypothetical protein EZS28_010091 [Streblomastix strix]|uniref:Uncharacterized protein n=1 Tax=Streblomastix strix TaxID=222440 RepID=A0A5J4WH39_9EUKA|nr:MAG: hypothetical protein EZS28_010091 [Streblomastix strix]